MPTLTPAAAAGCPTCLLPAACPVLQLCQAPGVPFTLDSSTSNNSQVVLSVPTKDLVAWLMGPNYAATCPLVPSVKELEALQPQAVLEAERADMAPLQQRITHCINREGQYVLKNKVGGRRSSDSSDRGQPRVQCLAGWLLCLPYLAMRSDVLRILVVVFGPC